MRDRCRTAKTNKSWEIIFLWWAFKSFFRLLSAVHLNIFIYEPIDQFALCNLIHPSIKYLCIYVWILYRGLSVQGSHTHKWEGGNNLHVNPINKTIAGIEIFSSSSSFLLSLFYFSSSSSSSIFAVISFDWKFFQLHTFWLSMLSCVVSHFNSSILPINSTAAAAVDWFHLIWWVNYCHLHVPHDDRVSSYLIHSHNCMCVCVYVNSKMFYFNLINRP